jgi:hypothetical protein
MLEELKVVGVVFDPFPPFVKGMGAPTDKVVPVDSSARAVGPAEVAGEFADGILRDAPLPKILRRSRDRRHNRGARIAFFQPQGLKERAVARNEKRAGGAKRFAREGDVFLVGGNNLLEGLNNGFMVAKDRDPAPVVTENAVVYFPGFRFGGAAELE